VSPRLSVAAAILLLAACNRPETAADHALANPGVATVAGSPAASAAADRPQLPANPHPAAGAAPVAVMYKDANCDCCAKWGDHLRAAGFTVRSHDVTDLQAVKRRHGIPASLQSCHTAEIGGYLVEGHVPADLIQKMLRDRPAIAGIAVPGMPVGSPGMEWTYTEPYDVIAFTRSGTTSVYASR
jgi:hypothetical protein